MKMIKFLNFAIITILGLGVISCGGDGDDGPGTNPSPGNPILKGTVGEAVDLGLPSGTLWASWNVGASSPDGYGCYYSWGECGTKNDYSLATYSFYDQEWQEYKGEIGSNIQGTTYDIATVMWGGDWRMPSVEEFEELVDNCTWSWIYYNNSVYGYKVEGSNGNKIFLPAAGRYEGRSLKHRGMRGYYWSGSLREVNGNVDTAKSLNISGESDNNYFYCGFSERYCGVTIRPVKKIPLVE